MEPGDEEAGTRPIMMEPPTALQREYWNAWLLANRGSTKPPHHILLQGAKVIELFKSLDLEAPRMLEVGCGTGWLAGQLSEYGEVLGTDIADEAVAIAQRRVPHARFVAGDFLTMELPDKDFDVCVSVEVLSHVADKRGFVDRVASLLKPGGFLVLTTQNRFVMERAGSGRVSAPAPGKISTWVTMAELKKLVKSQFDLLEATTINPTGNGGILRFVNSMKLDALLRLALAPETITRIKEARGLGETLVLLARRR